MKSLFQLKDHFPTAYYFLPLILSRPFLSFLLPPKMSGLFFSRRLALETHLNLSPLKKLDDFSIYFFMSREIWQATAKFFGRLGSLMLIWSPCWYMKRSIESSVRTAPSDWDRCGAIWRASTEMEEEKRGTEEEIKNSQSDYFIRKV